MCECCSGEDRFVDLNDMVNDVGLSELDAAITALKEGIAKLYGNDSEKQTLCQLPLQILEELKHLKEHQHGIPHHHHGHH